MELRPDLEAFLNDGRQLEYDADACEAGRIVLLPRNELKVRLYPTDVDNGPIDNSNDPHFRDLGCYLVRLSAFFLHAMVLIRMGFCYGFLMRIATAHGIRAIL